MWKDTAWSWAFIVIVVVFGLAVGGCAGTAATVKPGAEMPKPGDLAGYGTLAVDVVKAGGVEVGDAETARIARLILEAVEKKQPGRFKAANGAVADGAAQTVQATVLLTRYDKGNAVARLMLAGLGRIHIDARVSLKDATKGTGLGDYEVSKTFAWGGIYGGTTTVEDVELGFAEGVAEGLVGRR